ncbi:MULTISPECIES: GbsR/MarR family transcriptional regulator [unclassified Streptomyces]|uniref:GbsR/MarR family transcriptional regulator n=1 Tax=unclassified Streptomyces TaxID=2593676 RepID=UPI000CD5BFA0|nr:MULTISPECIES: MarR family transcriptional regulator [unclassified Streptomyces]AWL39288.1 MarR family transcriptional regulator [Streptomyces sp. SM18]
MTSGTGEAAATGSGGGAEDTAGRDEEAVSRFVERFAAEMTEAGMQRMASRVFAALLADDDGCMTSAEIGEQLRISPAAVSGAVGYLTQVSMVGREREPGSRRDRYRLHDEIWYETFADRDHVLTRWERTLRDGARSLGEDTPAGARIAETADFFAFLQEEMTGVMERWRASRSERSGAAR